MTVDSNLPVSTAEEGEGRTSQGRGGGAGCFPKGTPRSKTELTREKEEAPESIFYSRDELGRPDKTKIDKELGGLQNPK